MIVLFCFACVRRLEICWAVFIYGKTCNKCLGIHFNTGLRSLSIYCVLCYEVCVAEIMIVGSVGLVDWDVQNILQLQMDILICCMAQVIVSN